MVMPVICNAKNPGVELKLYKHRRWAFQLNYLLYYFVRSKYFHKIDFKSIFPTLWIEHAIRNVNSYYESCKHDVHLIFVPPSPLPDFADFTPGFSYFFQEHRNSYYLVLNDQAVQARNCSRFGVRNCLWLGTRNCSRLGAQRQTAITTIVKDFPFEQEKCKQLLKRAQTYVANSFFQWIKNNESVRDGMICMNPKQH